jgi:hypothetical protein
MRFALFTFQFALIVWLRSEKWESQSAKGFQTPTIWSIGTVDRRIRSRGCKAA